MATSGNIDRALTSWLTMRINWVVNSQDVATNKSNVTVKVQLITGNGSISSSASKAIKVSINGTTYNSTTTIGIAKNTTKTLYTKTVDVSHNSDGTKELALNCTLTFDATISGDWWADRYLGGTASLNTIARASTFTRSGTATMGSAQTIKITKKNSSFTHTLKYTWSGSTTTIVTKTTATSYSWTPPVSMAASIPNNPSGTCKLICETYNGSTLVGSDDLSFTLSVPASVVPTISAFTHSEAVTNIKNNFGIYVDTKSKITYAVTAAGAQGSTIKSYSVSIAGQKFSTATGTTKEINVGLTETSDSVGGKNYTATATVTDSRGRTATKEITITVYKYTPPTLTGFTVKRSTSAGVASDEGTALLVSYAAKIASVNNKNSGAIKIERKKTTDSTYTSARSISSFTGTYTENVVLSDITFATDTMYHVKITVSDLAGTTITSVYEVSTAKPMLDFKANKKGVGIGKVATEDDLLDVGYNAKFRGNVSGKALGLGALPTMAENDNANDYTDAGCWCVPTNAQATAMYDAGLNIPSKNAGRFIVVNGTGWDDPATAYKYRLQFYFPYLSSLPAFVRHIRKTDASSWIHGTWKNISGAVEIPFTPVSGVTVTRCTVSFNNDIVTMCFSGKYNAAIATTVSSQKIGSIATGFPTKSVVTCGLQGSGVAACWVTNAGVINIRPVGTNYTANTVIEFNLTWNVEAAWQ